MQVMEKRLFVAQKVPEIYTKNDRLINSQIHVFASHCISTDSKFDQNESFLGNFSNCALVKFCISQNKAKFFWDQNNYMRWFETYLYGLFWMPNEFQEEFCNFRPTTIILKSFLGQNRKMSLAPKWLDRFRKYFRFRSLL